MPITPQRVALIILAAGVSRRFGTANKLVAPLHGKPLGLHCAAVTEGIGFSKSVAVIGAQNPGYASKGFHIVTNPAPERGMGHSIALGVKCVAETSIDAVLIMLADMPFIPQTHILNLLKTFNGDRLATRVKESDRLILPPALFSHAHFPALQQLEGDKGARALLQSAQTLPLEQAYLQDIDTQEALEALAHR